MVATNRNFLANLNSKKDVWEEDKVIHRMGKKSVEQTQKGQKLEQPQGKTEAGPDEWSLQGVL